MIQRIKTENDVDYYVLHYEGEELQFHITLEDKKNREISITADLLRYLQISSSLGNDLVIALEDMNAFD